MYNKNEYITREEQFTKNQKINTLIMNYKIIQVGIKNLFIIKKRKINLRVYLLIQCQNNNKEFYLYNKGKCIYNQKDINKNDIQQVKYRNDFSNNKNIIDYQRHLTSYNLDPSIYNTQESFEDLSALEFQKIMG